MSEQEYIIRLKPMASDVPAILRLRKLLKIALRQCKLKCVDHREVTNDEVTTNEK